MVSVIECVWRQALQTFARSNSVQSFEDNFARLRALADSVSANDVKLDRCLLEWTSNSNSSNHVRKPPVTYIEIYEDHAVTIGIFVLRSGMRIPLHDHPQMHGILKVLTGTLKLQSYNVLPAVEQDTLRRRTAMGRNAIFVEKLPEVYVSDSDPACVLTPDEGNLHEIHSVDGPAAFLDILAPPYDSSLSENEERSCHYFQERKLHEDRTLRNKNIVALFRISSPSDFWSDSAPYTGPMLSSSFSATKSIFKASPDIISKVFHANLTYQPITVRLSQTFKSSPFRLVGSSVEKVYIRKIKKTLEQ